MNNPFTPLFGAVPMYLAGREYITNEMNNALSDWKSNPYISSLLIGPRGSGKTTMLSIIENIARENGWIALNCTSGNHLLENIYQKLMIESSELLEGKDNLRVKDIHIGNYLGLSFEERKETEFLWENRMDTLLADVNSNGTGVIILLDEINVKDKETVDLVSSYQIFRRNGRKIGIVMAGLPGKVYDLLNEEDVTFLRRANQFILGIIDDADIRQAFVKTIESQNKSIEEDALQLAINAIGGYPYMLQLVGYYIWRQLSENTNIITLQDVEQGIKIAKEKFTQSVLDSTYHELSAGDIKFLNAMLDDATFSVQKDIATRMNKPSGYINTYKKRLLQAGVIEETAGKRLHIILPFFKEYLMDLKESEE